MEREVPLLDFLDDRWRWRSTALLPGARVSSGRGGAGASSGRDRAVQTTEQAGCFAFARNGENGLDGFEDGEDAKSEGRTVVWRLCENGSVLEVLDFGLNEEIEGGAMRFTLPDGGGVVDGGLQWMERAELLVLCVCMKDGRAFACTFRCHPFTKDEKRRCFEGKSFLAEKVNSSPVEVVQEGRYKLIDAEVHTCHWFVDSAGTIHCAAGTRPFSGGGVAEGGLPSIHCLSFGTRGDVQEMELNDTSLAQRLWTGLLKRSARNPGAVQGSVHIVKLHSISRGGSRNDDTMLCAVYSDGKLRVWSLSQQSCRSEVGLLENIGAREQNHDKIELAWVKSRFTGSRQGTKHNFHLAIAVRLIPLKLFFLCLSGTASINQVNVDAIAKTYQLPIHFVNERLGGYRLVDIGFASASEDASNPTELRAIFWKPVNRESTRIVSLDLGKPPIVSLSLDEERAMMDDNDLLALQKTGTLSTYLAVFLSRLDQPGRFSSWNLRNGVISCFGTRYDDFLKHATHRWELLEKIREVLEAEMNKMDRHARLENLKSVCSRLLAECEASWLSGFRPLSFAVAASGMNVVVRQNMVLSLRDCDWAEDMLHSSQTSSRNHHLDGFFTSLKNFIRKIEEIGIHGNGQATFERAVADAIQESPFQELQAGLRRISRSFNKDPNELYRFLRALLSRLGPKCAKVNKFVEEDGEMVDEDDSRTEADSGDAPLSSGLQLGLEMETYSISQVIRARTDLASAVAFILHALSLGVSGLKEFFLEPPAEELKRSVAQVCRALSVVNWLGTLRPTRSVRSMDWLRQHSLKNSPAPFTSKSTNFSTLQSTLTLWIAYKVGREASGALNTIMPRICDSDGELVSFLDRSQQYDALGVVARASMNVTNPGRKYPVADYSRFYGTTASERKKCLNFLQAKALLWQLDKRSPATVPTGSSLTALNLFQGAAPDCLEHRYLYFKTLMDLYEKACQPKLAIDFGHRALNLSTQEDSAELWFKVFGLAIQEGDFRQALSAARMHGEVAKSRSGTNLLLSRLVSHLMDKGEVEALCQLPLQALSETCWREDVMKTLRRKIQIRDAVPSRRGEKTFFHSFYAFCIYHSRYAEAATCMYSLARSLEDSVHNKSQGLWDAENAAAYTDAVSACLCTLRMLRPEKATLFYKSGREEGKETVESVGLDDLNSMFVLSSATLTYLRTPGADPQIEMAVDGLVEGLLKVRKADDAVSVVKTFGMDASHVFVYLTTHCVGGDESWSVVQRQLRALDKLKAKSIVSDKGTTIELEDFNYHCVVLETLLQLKPLAEIPQWLLSSFINWGQFSRIVSNGHPFARYAHNSSYSKRPAEMIRILIHYDRLLEALQLASNLVALMQPGAFLPFKTIDVLIHRAQSHPKVPAHAVHNLQQQLEHFAREKLFYRHDELPT